MNIALPPRLEIHLRNVIAYPSVLAEASATAQGVPIGRWELHTTCRAGSALLDGVHETTVAVPFDLPELRQLVYGIRDRIEDQFELAWPTLEAVRRWIDNDLPHVAPALMQLESALHDGTRDQQREQFAQLDDVLAHASEVLSNGADMAPQLATDQIIHIDDTGDLVGPAGAETQQRLHELLGTLDAVPSGRRDLLEQFVHFQSELTASISVLNTCVHTLRLLTVTLAHALDALYQAVNTLRHDITNVRGLLAEGPMDSLDNGELSLSEVAQRWKEIADAATAATTDYPLRSPLRSPSLRARASAQRD